MDNVDRATKRLKAALAELDAAWKGFKMASARVIGERNVAPDARPAGYPEGNVRNASRLFRQNNINESCNPHSGTRPRLTLKNRIKDR
jgi:hypothetical protein